MTRGKIGAGEVTPFRVREQVHFGGLQKVTAAPLPVLMAVREKTKHSAGLKWSKPGKIGVRRRC